MDVHNGESEEEEVMDEEIGESVISINQLVIGCGTSHPTFRVASQ